MTYVMVQSYHHLINDACIIPLLEETEIWSDLHLIHVNHTPVMASENYLVLFHLSIYVFSMVALSSFHIRIDHLWNCIE